MNTGQTFLTIGAMILLSILVMNILRVAGGYEDVYNETRTMVEAVALTSSLIEEASQVPFDEVSWDSTNLTKIVTDFTLPNYLGPETGETSYALFDDFDDFNNFIRYDTTQQSVYQLRCEVCYVGDANPEVVSASRSYYKRLTVTTINQTSLDSIKLSYVHGYWYFN